MKKKLIVVDEDDNPVGAAYKEEIEEKKLNYRAVHTFLFDGEGRLLIGRRPANIKRFPNLWTSGSGGKVDEGESYEKAAVRELEEELGIAVKLEEAGSFVYINEHGGYKVFHRLFAGFCGECKLTPDPDEIAETKWISFEDIQKSIIANPSNYAPPFISAIRCWMKNRASFSKRFKY